MNVLQIDSSVLSASSISRQLTKSIVENLQQQNAGLKLTYRDVSTNPINHLSSEILTSRFIDASEWSDLQKAETALNEELLNELFAADVLVIGAPMYNFAIPTQLKSWLDRVLVAGRTFKYTEQGPVGLLQNKRAIIASSRGGMYSTSEAGRMMDFQEDYLRTAMRFIGITDVEIIRAEGVNVSSETKEKALENAMQDIKVLFA
jgi:FMN-dependent NADH-azoreductase